MITSENAVYQLLWERTKQSFKNNQKISNVLIRINRSEKVFEAEVKQQTYNKKNKF